MVMSDEKNRDRPGAQSADRAVGVSELGVGADRPGVAGAAPVLLTSALAQLQGDLAALPPGVTERMVFAADERGMTFGFVKRFDEHSEWRVTANIEQRFKKQR